jgi:hypothetical protein
MLLSGDIGTGPFNHHGNYGTLWNGINQKILLHFGIPENQNLIVNLQEEPSDIKYGKRMYFLIGGLLVVNIPIINLIFYF